MKFKNVCPKLLVRLERDQMGGQWLSCLTITEHVARWASTDSVFDVLIDVWPVYCRACEGFAFVHPKMTFMDAKQNVFLHARWDDDTIVVQNETILLKQFCSEGTVLA